jgi:hypothetical protein
LEGAYTTISQPVIFEYGSGASSIWHIRNLLSIGGTYTAVEHNPDWYRAVLSGVFRFSVQHDLSVTYTGYPSTAFPDSPAYWYDALIDLKGHLGASCSVNLRLRPLARRIQDSNGTVQDRHAYVRALDQPCDVVIVDGKARKECVNHVLDGSFLSPEGYLVLFEAGRGQEGWLDAPALTDSLDYKAEVQQMLDLGGELVDGCGLDRWPGLKRRRTPTSNAYNYPMEACFLQLTDLTGESRGA